MSRENVEVARRAIEAYNNGDMAKFLERYDPAVVMYHLEGWPEPGPSVGRDAVVREYKLLRDPWDGRDGIEVSGRFIEVANHVVVRVLWSVSGAHSPEGTLEMSVVLTFRNGRVITQQNFWDHSEALEAVGLRE